MGYEVTALALCTVAVGGQRPRRNPALVNIGPYGSQEPMTMYAGGDGQRPSEERHLVCHRQGSPDPGVYNKRSTHCRKRWEDIRRWIKKTAEAQLGMASQRGRGARRTMTPMMFRILAVAYPELYRRLRASQQPQGGEYTRILLIQSTL
ncbi:hypothetical protein NDU88_007487 [Pleurodeles waltl]|uniref:Uncharacterized protein n=1 Tax=Pleurodeles waltl TaxID=8319 RepID=A0AAV7VSH3_PLEWA|nr:hypothetical protein NDU88_007487 [Pleurodeles waltl]